MAIINVDTVFAAAGTVQNAWAGEVFEFLRADSTIKLGLVATVAGVTATWKIGDAIVMENAPVNVNAGLVMAANTDLLYVDAGRGGERLTLTLTATAASTCRSLAIIA